MARKTTIPKATEEASRVKLTPELVEGFVETFLLDQFEASKAIPDFHRTLWGMFCASTRRIAIAAPRGHAKSTACTLSFTLATVLFGAQDFVLVISATEDLAAGHLENIKTQLLENVELIDAFDVKVLKDNHTELVGTVSGRPFCIIAKGAEQKLRGLLWRNKRPGLIIIDDLEEDEQVMNKDRREKLRKWFNNAVLPVGSDKAQFRMVGTILHMDSLLERLLEGKAWTSRRFRAHRDFDDFSEILWPEKFTETRLRDERQSYIDDDNASGYSQEYLSNPIAEDDAYFKRNYFSPLEAEDRRRPKIYYAAVDFAISKSERADFTVITVGGVDSEGYLQVVEVARFKGDGLEIFDELFRIQQDYEIDTWVMERGQIEKSLGPFLRAEMRKRNCFLNIELVLPQTDKISRSKSIQKRMQAGSVLFDTEAEWFEPLRQEFLTFPRGVHDDQVDSLAWLGLFIDRLVEAPTLDEQEQDEYEAELRESESLVDGRSGATGY